MITNLLCQIIVSLVTNTVENVTEWDHMEPVPCDHYERLRMPGNLMMWGCTAAHMKGVGPKKKEVVTTIKEVSTLSFDWSGSARQVVSERIVSETREAFALEWNRAELKKQLTLNIQGNVFFATNWEPSATLRSTTVTNYNTLELKATGTNAVHYPITNLFYPNGFITNGDPLAEALAKIYNERKKLSDHAEAE